MTAPTTEHTTLNGKPPGVAAKHAPVERMPHPFPTTEKERAENEEAERAYKARKRGHVGDPLDGLDALRDAAIIGAAAHRAVAARAIDYVWQSIACPGNIVLAAGLPGGGKTTLFSMLLAARCNRTGAPLSILGRVMQPASREKYIVLIQEEHGETSAARKLEQACAMLGLPDDTLERVITVARKNCVIGSKLWKEVADLCSRGFVDSLWVDSLARVAQRGDANSEGDQAGIFAEVQRVIESAPDAAKPTAWVVAHARKGAQGATIEDVSGSVQRAAQADVVMLLDADRDESKRVASVRVSFIKIRDDDGDYPAACDFEVVNCGGHRRVTWRPLDVSKASLDDRIVELLRGGAKSENQLRSLTGRNQTAIVDALRALTKDRRVRKTKSRINGRLRDVYAVAGFEDVFAEAERARVETEGGEG